MLLPSATSRGAQSDGYLPVGAEEECRKLGTQNRPLLVFTRVVVTQTEHTAWGGLGTSPNSGSSREAMDSPKFLILATHSCPVITDVEPRHHQHRSPSLCRVRALQEGLKVHVCLSGCPGPLVGKPLAGITTGCIFLSCVT